MKTLIALIAAMVALGLLTPTTVQAGHGYYGHCYGGAYIVPRVYFAAPYYGYNCYPHYHYHTCYPRYYVAPRCYASGYYGYGAGYRYGYRPYCRY